VIALSVAAVLAIFILYTSIAGAGTPEIGPSTVGRPSCVRATKPVTISHACACRARHCARRCVLASQSTIAPSSPWLTTSTSRASR